MRLLESTRIDFLRYRAFWIGLSILLMALGLGAILMGKLRPGIDFAGGTQLTIRFRDEPDLERLRGLIADAGEQASIQRFRDGRHEVLVTLPLDPRGVEAQGPRTVEILTRGFHPEAAGRLDLNAAGRDQIAALLASADPEDRADGSDPEADQQRHAEIADAIVDHRSRTGLIGSLDELASAGVSATAIDVLRQAAYAGVFHVVRQESVGPQIGAELRWKGILAVSLSLAGMLAYIAFRFRLPYGIGAVAASLHDVLVTVGLYAILGFELDLHFIAALLTLVGYSVNDTVVVFDRVRENRNLYPRRPLYDVINRSLNDTLSRTVLTSGTTLLVTASLLVFGGQALRGFSFALTVGVVVGTYSTIYVASPIALYLEERAARRRESGGSRQGRPGAVRSVPATP